MPPDLCENDPLLSANSAGLRYTSDSEPGLKRVRKGRAFSYLTPDGSTAKDRDDLQRIRAIVIPPAWSEVWICRHANGQLQATGRDDRGRKQYRYHPLWRQVRDEAKYDRMSAFGLALPGIRKRVEADLTLPGLPREKVLATVVTLLETTLIRVGNEEYARTNESFGLTTLQDSHVRLNGTRFTFIFRGKSGKEHSVGLQDARLTKVIRRCRDLPGQTLFQYRDADGDLRPVGSADVNAYLRDITGQDFTAKDFRTWFGSVLAAEALCESKPGETEGDRKRQVITAIECVASRLGNTPAVCRACYVHPAVTDAFLSGELHSTIATIREPRNGSPSHVHSRHERLLLRLLEANRS